MRTTSLLSIVVLFSLSATAAAEPAEFPIRGQGAEGRTPYTGGGAIKFLDASLAAQVVHYDGKELRLPLAIRYEVLQTAPIRLTSRLGSEYWQLYSVDATRMTPMYADDKLDLSKPGEQTATTRRAWFSPRSGPLPPAGLAGIRGRYYFLIDQPDGRWLDVATPPPFFDQRAIVRKLTMTLANLSKYTLALDTVQSTWKARGPLRLRLTVTDADGKTLPVVNVPLVARSGTWQTTLTTEWGPLDEPTGWMRGRLPAEVPEAITLEGHVSLETPEGPREQAVRATIPRGRGQLGDDAFRVAEQGYQLPRNAQGIVRETRAVWVAPSDLESVEEIQQAVDRIKQAGLNTIIPDIFLRNSFLARSPLFPADAKRAPGFDPLACLLDKAHAVGLEVHPWFCVTYRDQAFRDWFRTQHGTSVDMLDKTGKVIPLGADVHRPAYRDFIVNLMVGVARDYPVDGIHLDYIRSMDRCFCPACQAEFAQRFGKPLDTATDEDWTCWQREAIGQIVQRTAEGTRNARPGALMSAAVFSSLRSGALQGQDPAGWARQGWIDLVLPMDYQMQSLAVRANEGQFLEALDDDAKLVTGLSLYMRSNTQVSSRPAELVRDQIELVRRLGIHGYCLFALNHLSDEQFRLLRDELNREPAVPYFRTNR